MVDHYTEVLFCFCVILSNLAAVRPGLAGTAAPPADLLPVTEGAPHELWARRAATPLREPFKEGCEYQANNCLKGYVTGMLCGRALYHVYYNFKNYCMLEFVNCMENYDVWQVLHMGACFTLKDRAMFQPYSYADDHFYEQYYAVV